MNEADRNCSLTRKHNARAQVSALGQNNSTTCKPAAIRRNDGLQSCRALQMAEGRRVRQKSTIISFGASLDRRFERRRSMNCQGGIAMTWTPVNNLAQAVWDAGFSYDQNQGIIYSRMSPYPFQYALGHCWAYDETSAPLSMIIDCERFYFPCQGYQWLIELWKGQYGLETGCEIGLYSRNTNGRWVPPQASWYPGVAPAQMLQMSLRLYTPDGLLLHRGPMQHWWLTGFKWGKFQKMTHELSLDVNIQFLDSDMRDAFLSEAQIPVRSPKDPCYYPHFRPCGRWLKRDWTHRIPSDSLARIVSVGRWMFGQRAQESEVRRS